jgi:hypothetical protein
VTTMSTERHGSPLQLRPIQSEHARRLGAVEQFFFRTNQVSPVHFVAAVEIGGVATASDWRKAVLEAQRRHKLLQVIIKVTPEGDPYFAYQADEPIAVRVMPIEDAVDVDSLIASDGRQVRGGILPAGAHGRGPTTRRSDVRDVDPSCDR